MILSLDPSSTVIGYALLRGPVLPRDLLEAGRIKPRRSDDPSQRAFQMTVEAMAMARQHAVKTIIVETPSPNAPSRVPGGARGQATYGMAVGILLGCLYSLRDLDVSVHEVRADVWTRGRKKGSRARVLEAQLPALIGRDRGHDAADAIELGVWWFENQLATV